jgi:hypothetical protein
VARLVTENVSHFPWLPFFFESQESVTSRIDSKSVRPIGHYSIPALVTERVPFLRRKTPTNWYKPAQVRPMR